jgi:hypothetical protein
LALSCGASRNTVAILPGCILRIFLPLLESALLSLRWKQDELEQ